MKKQTKQEKQLEELRVLSMKHPAEMTDKEKKTLEALRNKYKV